MRILYIVTAFPRATGDVITPWLIETIERLRSRDMEVEVLAPSYRGLKDHTYRGIRVHRFRYAPAYFETLTHDQTTPDRLRERPLYAALLPGYLIAGTLAAARLALTRRFDVVHAFWPLPHGLFGLSARRFGRIPLVCTFFGVELTWMRHQLPFLGPLVRWIVRRSDAVTVISSHTAAQVRSLVPDASLRVIPFGAALPEAGERTSTMGAVEAPGEVTDGTIEAPTEVAAGKGERGEVEDGAEEVARQPTLPAHRPGPGRREGDVMPATRGYRLLFVGRLVERKGVDVLLRAVASLVPGRDVRLTVVGDGPLRPSLERLARELAIGDRVSFRGFVDSEQLRELFRECDALVLPAVKDAKGDVEGLGVVLIEALAQGKPVIASASGGIPDIVKDEETGLLVTPGDPEELARAVVRLESDPALAERLARAGRQHVERNFSWDAITASLSELYASLAGDGGGRVSGDAAGAADR